MITRDQYLMGRGAGMTPEVSANVDETVTKVNLMLERAAADGVFPGTDQVTGNEVASGLRPAGVNSRTANAAVNSTHITGKGCDLQDTEDRALARWCLKNLKVLEEIGLWMEHPQWTSKKNPETGTRDPWVHTQTVPPGSKKRVYVPSMAAATAPALPEQSEAGVGAFAFVGD